MKKFVDKKHIPMEFWVAELVLVKLQLHRQHLGTPFITSEKLHGKNYLPWSASIKIWFLGKVFMIIQKNMGVEYHQIKFNTRKKIEL